MFLTPEMSICPISTFVSPIYLSKPRLNLTSPKITSLFHLHLCWNKVVYLPCFSIIAVTSSSAIKVT